MFDGAWAWVGRGCADSAHRLAGDKLLRPVITIRVLARIDCSAASENLGVSLVDFCATVDKNMDPILAH